MSDCLKRSPGGGSAQAAWRRAPVLAALALLMLQTGWSTAAQAQVPTLVSISPNSGPTAGGTSVTITGTNFTGATAVKFGSNNASSYTVNSTTSITATAPAGNAGAVDITVTTPYDTSATSAADQFTYVVTPSVANAVSATVAHGSSSNPITLNITGGAPTSVAVASAATHGTAAASGTTITYTPTARYSGTDTFTYTATNGSGTSSPATVTITVSDATISYAPASPSAGTVGNSYSQSLAGASGASGGTAPYSYVLASGTLPAGVTLAPNGQLSGTPTAGGTFNFTVTATDSSTGTGPFSATSGTLTLVVGAPTISISPVSLSAASVGATYSGTVTASGGTAPYSYAVTSGALPAGLSLASNGQLSGTPTAGGTFNITVRATDSATGTGAPFSTDRAYTLTVNAPTISISPGSLPAASVGTAYSSMVTASGGTAPYSYAVTSGALPTGLTLASNGTLSGTPTAGGTFNFTVTATDSSTGTPYTGSQAYTLSLGVPTLSLSPSSGVPFNGTAGSSFSQSFSASGGLAPYHFAALTITAGSLPTGLSYNTATGTLSGTPTSAGSVSFLITATDSTSGAGPSSQTGSYTLTIAAPTLTVSPSTLPNAIMGTAYNQAVSASGGAAPYSYTVSAGSLPTGLTLNSANGFISGTPTAQGIFSFTVTATDANSFTSGRAFTVVTNLAAPVAGAHVVTAQANTPKVIDLATVITGGAASSVNVAGSPSNGTATASGTTITYTPATGYSGSDSFTYTATNGSGTSSPATVTVTVTPLTVVLTPATLPAPTLGSAYAATLSASGGSAPYTYSVVSGSLPIGITLSGNQLTGAPSAAGSYSFTLRVRENSGFTGSQTYTLVVQAQVPTAPPVAVSTGPNQPVTINAAANATGAPFTGVTVHSAPASGTVAVQGMNLVYTPAASTQGAISFSYTLANASGTSAPIAVTVQVAARPDPTANADVRGLSTAQQQATVRFAGAQLLNFSQRLESLRNPNRQAFQNGLQLAMPRAGNNSIRNCQNVPSMLGQQECIARQGMDSRASLAPRWSRAAQQDALAMAEGLTAEQAYASRLDSEAAEPAAAASLGSTQRNLAQRAVALSAGGTARTQRVNADEPLPAPGSPERPRLAYWTAGMLDWGFADASKGQDDGLRFTTSGVTMGFDYLVNAQWTVGMGMGLAYDRTTIGSDGSRNHSKGVSTALYGSWSPAPAYFVDGVLGYSRLRFDTRRWVADAGEFAQGERKGSQWFASVSAGYEWRTQQMMLSPYGRLQWARSDLDGYTETGAGWHALRFGDQRITSTSASLGLRGETSHDIRWGQLLPFGRLELQHDFDGQSAVRIAYADLAGTQSGYAISNSPIGRNRVQVGFGSRLQSRIGTFAAELQFTRSNTSFQRGLRLSYTTRY